MLAVCDKLQCGFAKALLGKAVLSDHLAFSTGQIGLLGTKASWELMKGCDTLLMIGSTFPYSEFLPKEGQAKCVQIDIDPTMLSLRYPADVALVGDAGATLEALLTLLEPEGARRGEKLSRRTLRRCGRRKIARHISKPRPLNPELFFWELSARCRPMPCLRRYRHVHHFFCPRREGKRGIKTAISGTLATMGPAVSYALAAKFAFPDRPAIAFVGDGAMQMLGMNGLITAAKYYKRWSDPRLIIAVLNNKDLNMVSWELRALGGSPKVAATQDLPDIDYAAQGELLGLKGLTVARRRRCGAGVGRGAVSGPAGGN